LLQRLRLGRIIRKAKFFSYRLDGTNLYAKVEAPEIVDPALLASRLLHSKYAPSCENYALLIVVGTDLRRRWKLPASKLIAYVQGIVKYLNDLGYIVVCFPHREGDMFYYPFLKGLNVKFVDWNFVINNPVDALAFYKYASFVVTTRGHSQYLALSYRKPFINIYSQPKNVFLMEAFGLKQFCCSWVDACETIKKRSKTSLDMNEEFFDERPFRKIFSGNSTCI